jgi:opacity protein-like surface antigen
MAGIGMAAAGRGIAVAALLSLASPAFAQRGTGDGFLFRQPTASFTVYGGLAQPLAGGDLFSFTRSELTIDRADLRSGSIGFDLALKNSPRIDLVFSFERSATTTRSEFRDWVDNNNLPIEQTTVFRRVPLIASVRYFLADRGRQVGSVAWIPAQFTPFVGLGGGLIGYRFEQVGDFIDQSTLNVFSDRLEAKEWTGALQASAGAQWTLSPHVLLTGEFRYLHATGDPSKPNGDFVGYKLDLSGVTTLLGITFRL